MSDLPKCYRCESQPCSCRGAYGDVLWRCQGFVWWTVRRLAQRVGPFDFEGAIQAGMLVVVQAYQDGEINSAAVISAGAKRRIRREITNTFRCTRPVSWTPEPQIPDYGYADGRTVRKRTHKPPKDKFARYRHRQSLAGLCPRCGQPPECFRLCDRCREKKRESYRRCRELHHNRGAT